MIAALRKWLAVRPRQSLQKLARHFVPRLTRAATLENHRSQRILAGLQARQAPFDGALHKPRLARFGDLVDRDAGVIDQPPASGEHQHRRGPHLNLRGCGLDAAAAPAQGASSSASERVTISSAALAMQ